MAEAAEEGNLLMGHAGAMHSCTPGCGEQPDSMADVAATGDCESLPLMAGLIPERERPQELGSQLLGANGGSWSSGVGQGHESGREAVVEGEASRGRSEALHAVLDPAALGLPLLRVHASPRGAAAPVEERQRFRIDSPGAHGTGL